MDSIDQLVQDIFEDKVDVSTLSLELLDQVLDRVSDIAENLLDGPHHDAACAIIEVLSTVVDEKLDAEDMSCFEDAIAEAEKRGSVYWEFDTYTIH